MMDAGRWETVKRLFEAALGHPAARRAAFVESECGADVELRREVESLLAAHAEAGSFAEQPPVPATGLSAAALEMTRGDPVRLQPGAHVGSYEIREFLAAGAMGDVYRGHDVQLRRDVALKILPPSFNTDPDRVARFEREARLLAALNHPHIAAIYGLEEAPVGPAEAGHYVRALILELVDGETLADRLGRGRLPLNQALAIARQMAEALEAAHERGIIHRDLKPANIKITPDGTVKVLDFGLAKAFVGDRVGVDLSGAPTLTGNPTREGVIAGTPRYMSPEQARGQMVDKRTDIWAFGCVLYEMLTARTAFPGETIGDTLAAVLDREPQWDALPHTTSPPIRKLLRRCLAKDRKQRLSDATAVRLEIEEAQSAPTVDPALGAVRPPTRHQTALAASAAALMAGVAVGLAFWLTLRPASPSVSRLLIPLSAYDFFAYPGRHLVAFAPDDRQIVYQANQGLYLRRLDQLEPRLLTDGGGRSPFFSPDGQTLGFWVAGELKRVGLSGGAPVTVCKADIPWGVSWEANGRILFGQGSKGIWSVPDTGGMAELLISVEAGAEAHGPQLLPGGEWVLFTLRPAGVSSWNAAQIVAQSLATRERKVLIQRGRDARYVASGHLVYAVEQTLMAVAFEVDEIRTMGEAVTVLGGIGIAPTGGTGAVHFSVSRAGSLVYVPEWSGTGQREQRMLVWVDRQGKEDAIDAPVDGYRYPRISPDGAQVALDVVRSPRSSLALLERDIWIWNVARRALTRFTVDVTAEGYPVWAPDGRRLAWQSQRASGSLNLYWQAADGTGEIERLTESPNEQSPYAFSPDGRQLLLREEGPGFAETLSLLTVNGNGRATPILRTMFNHRNGEFSPDGRWLAYESDESGREEIYVRPFPNVDSGRWQVSTGGGLRPLWARNAPELFYQSPDGALLRVPVSFEHGSFQPGIPTKLIEGRYYMRDGGASGRTYDVSPDGQRFLMIKDAPGAQTASPPQLVVVLNWVEELKRLVPR